MSEIKPGDIVYNKCLGVIFEVRSIRRMAYASDIVGTLISLRGSVFDTHSWKLHEVYNQMDAEFLLIECVVAPAGMLLVYTNLSNGV
jgi:hypothetical protein